MGKRKSKRKPPPKAKNIRPLETQFNCPFCNHESSCEVKICVGEEACDLQLPFRFATALAYPPRKDEKGVTYPDLLRDKDRNVGFISCRVCLEDFQTSINYLSAPIDVYSDWIDACEQANQ